MRLLRPQLGFVKMRLVVAALALIGALAHAKTPDSEYRLPTHFEPVRYKLNVITHLDDRFAFEGVVRIRIVCTHAVDTVVLHANGLDVDAKGVKIDDDLGKPVAVSKVSFDTAKEFMYVKSAVEFKVHDEYVLTVPFAGKITDNMVGYYRSSYVDTATNETRWLAVTQFEPANARRAFPCFDEPIMKAKFKIRLGHNKHLTSVSNMPLTKTSPLPSHPDYVLDEFEESVPMSTYLVAYMVSDFQVGKFEYRRGEVKFRILARKDAANQTRFAEKVGLPVLRFYEKYFDEKFPLHKQDMAAIPDFSAGAMENWGLITYRETELLIDSKKATINDIYRVADVIAHEIAHQWFGNLVTMKWWTDLWLNEGFATYAASLGVNFMFPEWNSFQTDTVQKFMTVLHADSLHTSHPVSVPVGHPDEIAQIFDPISYTKGAYLLHMMNKFLGEKTFKESIRDYVHKYKYSNAEQDDLWDILTDEAHRVGSLNKDITVKEIMDTWTLQTGYPVIKVIRNYTDNTMTISQKRFLSTKSGILESKICWWVPLTMTFSSEFKFDSTKVHTWLNCKNNHLTISLSPNEDWVLFNIQLAGLYRVSYDDQNWKNIIQMMSNPNLFKKVHMMNRALLVEDALTFAYVGELDYRIAFQILKYLKYEKEYTPWVSALEALGRIGNLMRRTPSQRTYQGYMRRLLLPMYHQSRDMTVELHGFEEIQLKKLILNSACHNLLKDCTDQALLLFQNWMKSSDPDNNNILPKDLKSVIYCHGLKHGAEDEWHFMWNRYLQSNIAAEKSRILLALGCTSKILLLKKYLTWTIGENAIIRKQDAVMVFCAVAGNDFGFVAAKNFLYNNIEEISKYFYPQNDLVGIYVKAIGSQLKTKKELEDLQLFIKRSSVYLKGSEMAINQTIEKININIEWMAKFYYKISNFLIHM